MTRKSLTVSPFLGSVLGSVNVVTEWQKLPGGYSRHMAYECQIPALVLKYLPAKIVDWLTKLVGSKKVNILAYHPHNSGDLFDAEIVAEGPLDLSIANELWIEANRDKLIRHK